MLQRPADVGDVVDHQVGRGAETRTQLDYVEAGMELLAEDGVRAVTIANLCRRLGVTKGSFYHHFRNVEEFRSRLLTHWAGERERQVLADAAAASDPIERLDVLKRSAIALPHEAEAAIRAWSRDDATARRVRAKVDAARAEHVARSYADAGVDPAEAALLGRMSVALLVGVQHLDSTVDRDELRAMFDWAERAALDRALTPSSGTTR